MLAIEQPIRQSEASALPADMWGAIARAALRAEGDDVRVWERLCRVNSTWRAGLTGAYSACHSARRAAAVVIWQDFSVAACATASNSQAVLSDTEHVCRLHTDVLGALFEHAFDTATGGLTAGVPVAVTFTAPDTVEQMDGLVSTGSRCGASASSQAVRCRAPYCSRRCERHIGCS